VARAAVTGAQRIDERAILTLGSGLQVPVSRRFLPALRATGWL